MSRSSSGLFSVSTCTYVELEGKKGKKAYNRPWAIPSTLPVSTGLDLPLALAVILTEVSGAVAKGLVGVAAARQDNMAFATSRQVGGWLLSGRKSKGTGCEKSEEGEAGDLHFG